MPEQSEANCGNEKTEPDHVKVEFLGAVASADEEGGQGGERDEGDEGGTGGLGDAEPGCLSVFPVELFRCMLRWGISLHDQISGLEEPTWYTKALEMRAIGTMKNKAKQNRSPGISKSSFISSHHERLRWEATTEPLILS